MTLRTLRALRALRNGLVRRGLPFLALATLSSCASHNSHRIEFDGDLTIRSLAADALADLRGKRADALRENEVAMAVDIDPVDVTFAVNGEPIEREALRRQLEDEFVELLGPALTEKTVDEAELRFDAWLLIDIRRIDEVALWVACVLTERDAPRKVIAEGLSPLHVVPRLRCFGCRDDLFADTGTSSDVRDRSGSRGVWFFGWGVSYFHGHGGHRSSYMKVRR